MAENRITKKWLKNHWTYSWWKYLLLAVLCVFGVNIVFTTTAYRAPDHKKIELYIANSYIEYNSITEELTPVFFERHPDQEEFLIQNINLASEDMYVRMQFSTYIAAQQGDVLLLPYAEMKNLIGTHAEEAFINLAPYIDSGVIDAGGIDLSAGKLTNVDGEEGIYCIPADSLYGLLEHGNDPAGSCLCVTAYCGNEDVAASVVGMLFERYRTEIPQWYIDQQNKQPATSVLF